MSGTQELGWAHRLLPHAQRLRLLPCAQRLLPCIQRLLPHAQRLRLLPRAQRLLPCTQRLLPHSQRPLPCSEAPPLPPEAPPLLPEAPPPHPEAPPRPTETCCNPAGSPCFLYPQPRPLPAWAQVQGVKVSAYRESSGWVRGQEGQLGKTPSAPQESGGNTCAGQSDFRRHVRRPVQGCEEGSTLQG